MLAAYPAIPLLPHAFKDNTMPERDWSIYDRPSWGRFKSTRVRIPVLNWARSRRIDRTLKRIK